MKEEQHCRLEKYEEKVNTIKDKFDRFDYDISLNGHGPLYV
jgi:hypothetical protein